MSISRCFISLVGVVLMMAAVTPNAVAQQPDVAGPSTSKRVRSHLSMRSNRGSTTGSETGRFERFASLQPERGARTEDRATERVEEDSVSLGQSVDAFTSLEDGRPGRPGEWELELNVGWITTSDESDPVNVETQLQYTLDGSDFLRNMQLTLSVPVEIGNGEVDGNADIELGWQQRWVTEDGAVPTLATLVELRVPSGFQSSGVDVGLTGIVAKNVGPGTLFFNAFLESANGDNEEDLRNLQWGVRTGYKWRLADNASLIFDYVHESSEERGDGNSNLLELSGEYHVNDHLIIGPGIMIGLDGKDETPNFGAGVRVTLEF